MNLSLHRNLLNSELCYTFQVVFTHFLSYQNTKWWLIKRHEINFSFTLSLHFCTTSHEVEVWPLFAFFLLCPSGCDFLQNFLTGCFLCDFLFVSLLVLFCFLTNKKSLWGQLILYSLTNENFSCEILCEAGHVSELSLYRAVFGQCLLDHLVNRRSCFHVPCFSELWWSWQV